MILVNLSLVPPLPYNMYSLNCVSKVGEKVLPPFQLSCTQISYVILQMFTISLVTCNAVSKLNNLIGTGLLNYCNILPRID